MGQGRVCGGQSLKKKTPGRAITLVRGVSKLTPLYTSLEAVDNFGTSVVSRACTIL